MEWVHGVVDWVHGDTVHWVTPNSQCMDLRPRFNESKGYAMI
jgi:hypothetical protein